MFEFWSPDFVSHVTRRVNPDLVGGDVRGDEQRWWRGPGGVSRHDVHASTCSSSRTISSSRTGRCSGTHTGTAFYDVAPSASPSRSTAPRSSASRRQDRRALGRPALPARHRADTPRSVDRHRAAGVVNRNHEVCDSDEWRAAVRDFIIPWAVGEGDLGDEVLEVGPGNGATTDVFREQFPPHRGRARSRTGPPAHPAPGGHKRDRDRRRRNALARSTPIISAARRASRCCTTCRRTPCRTSCSPRSRHVVQPGGLFVASDSLPSDDLAAFHEGDTYMPLDPEGLATAWSAPGFVDVDVHVNELRLGHARTRAVARTAFSASSPATRRVGGSSTNPGCELTLRPHCVGVDTQPTPQRTTRASPSDTRRPSSAARRLRLGRRGPATRPARWLQPPCSLG